MLKKDKRSKCKWFRALGSAMLCCLCVCLSGCGSHGEDGDTWAVIFTSLPEKISLDNIAEGAVPYIFHQTHEPLFRVEDGQNFKSRILTDWSRNINYTEYEFCPDESLRFNAETSFSADYFSTFIAKVTGKYNPDFRVSRKNDCFVVNFSSSQPRYLNFLTDYSNAPSVTEGTISYGLGQFSVKNVAASAIELVRKKPVSNGYNRIKLYPYAGPDDPNLKSRQISDFNKISSFQRPDWIKTEYRGFDNIELRVVGLAINHPDLRVRRALYNCVDVDEFRRAAVPARKDFYDIQTLLPVGVPGAKIGRVRQECVPDKRLKGMNIVFANPRSDNNEQLVLFAKKLRQKTGMNMIVKQYHPEEMNPMLFNMAHARPYNLAVIVTENDAPDPDGFFPLYAGENRVVDNVPSDMVRTFNKLQKENDYERKTALAETLASNLAKEAFVLPLYQTMTTLYYPTKIKNLPVGLRFVEIPDVADFKW